MKRSWIATALVVSALAATTACAGSDDPREYRASEEGAVQSVSYGTVQSVRQVHVESDSAPVGTIAGAAVGGLLGSQIGHGSGRAAGAVLGAVGGGVAGNAIDHKVNDHDGQEIIVRLDNGSTIAVVQGAAGDLRPGDRVQVLSGRGGARVERI